MLNNADHHTKLLSILSPWWSIISCHSHVSKWTGCFNQMIPNRRSPTSNSFEAEFNGCLRLLRRFLIQMYQTHMLHLRCSYTYVWLVFMVNVGTYSIHEAYGIGIFDYILLNVSQIHSDTFFLNQDKELQHKTYPYLPHNMFLSNPWRLQDLVVGLGWLFWIHR